MSEPFIAEIIMFGGNFAPRGWALCNGQLLAIASNTALFSILGTTYGGDGRTTFGLPDLRGRVPMHSGQGAGLSNRSLGQKGGQETHTLTATQLGSHSHGLADAELMGTLNPANSNDPTGKTLGLAPTYSTGAPSVALAAGTVDNPATTANSAGSQAHNNMQPYQVVNFIIALVGVFPSRN